MRSAITMTLAAAASVAILGSVGTAAAQTEGGPADGSGGGMQLTDRDFFVGFGVGFSVGFGYGAGAAFRIEEHVGYHVLNVDEHPGLYIAFAASQSIAGVALLGFAGRVGFDILLWSTAELALLLNPSLQLGAGVITGSLSTVAAFLMHPGLEVALALLEGLLHVWWRPVGFDVFINDGGATALYAMLWGVNFWF
jgi:hypothetical protein